MTTWTTRVECAFTTAPSDPSPDWEDITAYVMPVGSPIRISRGRADEFAEVSPGTCDFELLNSDGRFTPGNAASPYYPYVKKGRRLRVSVDYAGVTYTRFDGYVDQWPQRWPGGVDTYAVASVSCSDRLKRLGRIGNLRSLLEQEILADTPRAYYTLGEPEASTSAGNSSVSTQPALTVTQIGSGGTIEFGAGTGPGADGMSAPVFTPVNVTNGQYLAAKLAQGLFVGGGALRDEDTSIRAAFLTSTAADQIIVSVGDANGLRRLELSITAAGKLHGELFNVDGSSAFSITSAATVSDGATHDAALVTSWVSGTDAAELFLDGVSVGTASPTLGSFAQLLLYLRIGGRSTGRLFTGTISHVALYADDPVTAARVASHYEAGTGGFEGDSSDERIARIASYAGVTDTALDAGDTTSLVAQATGDQSPLALMQAVTNTESGLLFIDTDGALTFHNRSRRFNAAPEMTLSADDGDISPELTFVLDDQFKVNDLTVTRTGGATHRVVNQDSIDDDDRYVDSLEVLTTSDLEAADIGNWRLGQYANPEPRCPSVGVMLHAQGSTTGFADIFVDEFVGDTVPYTVLNTDLGVKIRLADLPSNAPAATVDLFAEGYTESIGTHTWTIDYNTSPAAGVSTIFRLDDPVYSLLDSGNRLAY